MPLRAFPGLPLLIPFIFLLKTRPTVLCLCLVASLVSRLPAADRTWDGLGADDLWSNLDNWDGIAPVAGDALFFGGVTRLTPGNDIIADTLFAGINFNSGAGAFNLSGNRITLGGNILNSSSSLQLISLAMILDAARTVDTGASGITLSGILSGPGGIVKQGSGTLALSGSGTNTYDVVTDVAAGQLNLSKIGGATAVSGDLTLSGAGTALVFTASGTQNQIADDATVTLNGAGSVLGNTAATFGTVIGATAVTEEIANLNITNGMFFTGTGIWTISSSGVFDGATGDARYLHNSGGTVNFGSLSLAGMTATGSGVEDSFIVLGNSGALRSTVVVGSGGLSLDNSRLVLSLGTNVGTLGSRLVLNGNVSATGTLISYIQLGSGTLGTASVELSGTSGDHTRTFTVGAGGAGLIVNVAITNGAATNGSLIKDGAGTLLLSGTSANTYTGITTVSDGVLNLGKTGGVNAVGGDLTINGAGDVIFAAVGAQNQILDTAKVIINGAGSTLNGTGANSGTVRAVTETIGSIEVTNGFFNTAAGSVWTVAGAGVFDGTGVADVRFVGNSGSVISFDSLTLTGMTNAVIVGVDSFVMGGASNTVTSTLTVGAGGLVLNGSVLGLNRGGSADQLGSRLILNGNVSTTGTTASTISTSASFNKGDIELSSTAGSHTRTFTIGGGGANLTVGVVITNGAATNGGISKDGVGTMTLSGDNTYTGDTTVSEGILAIGASERINNTSNLNVTGTGTFDLGASRTETVGAVSVSATAGGIIGTGTSTLIGTSYSISNASGIATISVSLGGSGTLDKTGEGTLLLSGGTANTYSGLTTVSAGILSLAKSSGAVAVSGDLTVAGTGDVIFAAGGAQNQISNTAAVIVNGTGGNTGTTLNGIGANDGIITVTETIGSISVLNGNFNTGAASNWTVTGAGVFDGSGAADTRFIGNSGSVTTFDSLSLTAMTGTTIVSSADSFVLGGNSTTVSTVRVGAGGLALNGSIVALNQGTGSTQGSRLVLDGDVTTTGSAASSISKVGGSINKADVELSSTAGDHVRTFDIGGGGADLTVGVAITNGAATNGGIVKEGAGVLILTGANTYTGNTTVSEGVLTIATTGALPGWDTSGRYSVASGATLAVRNAVTDGNVTTMLTTTNFAAGSSIGFDTSTANRTYALTLENTAQGSLGLTKLGANNLVLTGPNTYSGETNVLQGALIINGDQSAASGAVVVSAGATLGGDGTVGGDTVISGSLRVGSDIGAGTTGSLDFSSENLTFANGSTWFIDIVGATNDTLSGIDILSIDPGATLSFNFSGPTQQSYTLATYGSRANSNTFSGFEDGDVFSGYQINYGSTSITLTAVPEPGTLAILGLALSGLLLRRVLRRRARGGDF